MAAITFTNKATSELKSRFLTELEKAARNAGSGEETELLKEANENVNQCFIGTIHSFCGSLLRERPLEAGIDPSFTEMDEDQTEEFLDQCWDEYVSNFITNGQTSELAELTSYGVDSETLRTVYHRMAKNLDVSIFTKEVDYPDFDRIMLSLPPLIEEAKAYFPSTRPKQGWDTCQKTMLDALQMMEIKDFNDDLTVLQIAESFEKNLGVTLNRWTDQDVAKEFKNEKLPEWQEHVLRPFLRSWREFLHPKIVRFVMPAIEYGQVRKQERGLVDFQDLLLNATKLLREHKEVRNYFKQRYTHLLVDEFQDTDPVQAEMMLLLTGEEVTESDWKKQVPKKGSLFIVGDPKQSIYRFRRADISTYHFVMKKIEENGEVLQLTSNFRSVESIGKYVDPIFESKFSSGEVETPVQATFAPMNTIQPNPGALHGVYSITHPKVTRNKASDICEMDSSKIASFISWASQGNLKIQERHSNGDYDTRDAHPGDFLILLKRKDNLHIYAEKLEQFGILSDITGSTTRYEELTALVLLVKALKDHHDAVTLLAVLRGMFFGCSDEDLYRYKRAFQFFNVFHLPNEEEVTEETRIVYNALLKLQHYHQWVNQWPALTAFVNIIEDIGLLPYSVVKDSGLIRAGTIVQIIDQVQADPFASANWNDLLSPLLRLFDEEKKKGVEGTGLFLGSPQAVRIMNLHKAKGLEAPVVFLAAPVGESEHPVTEHVDRMGDEPTGYFTISKDKKVIAEPFGWVEKEEIEIHFKHAEEDRLLYVAATRPKQMLVISQYPENPKISPWSELSQSISVDRELIWEERVPKEKEALTEVPDLPALMSDWNLWLEKAKNPSFKKSNVTSIVKGESETVVTRSKEGKGPVFGTVIHRCMEQIGKAREDVDLANLVSLVSEEEGLIQENQDAAHQTVQAILASDIWRRGQQAEERYYEFSFILWLVLENHPSWSEPVPIGKDEYEYPHKHLWYQLRSYLVPEEESDQLINWLKDKNFMGRWFPEGHDQYQVFSREYYWSPAYYFFDNPYYGGHKWKEVFDDKKRVIAQVLPTTQSHSWETGTDYENQSYLAPSEYMFSKMQLQYSKNIGEWLSEEGQVLCLDPSVNSQTSSCLIVKKDIFLKFLSENKLKIIWTCLGEKRIRGNTFRQKGNTKWLETSGVYYLNNSDIVGKMNYFIKE